MNHGARKGRNTNRRRWLARLSSRSLSALVVPGPELADVYGLDLGAADIGIAANPRQANVLLVLGPLPPAMAKAGAVLWAQMPRPRALLALGEEDIAPLPGADVRARIAQRDLEHAVVRLRAILATAWSEDAGPFEPEALAAADEDGEEEEQSQAHGEHRHDGDDDHAEHQHDHGHDQTHDNHQDEAQGSGHQSHDHGGMDFMSMVEMTKDLPRSADGLAMEWLQEVPFGPCFPGLPGGLVLALTLDGGTVAEACARSALLGHFRPARLPLEPDAFVDWLSSLDPLAADAYRLLAMAALEQAAGFEAAVSTQQMRAWCLERQRVISHAGWLARFGRTLGLPWLQQSAASLQRAWVREPATPSTDVHAAVRKLRTRLDRTPLLESRLAGVGMIAPDAVCVGPVARARGNLDDVRCQQPVYTETGFEPVQAQGGDAWTRMQVRLGEIERSLELMQRLRRHEGALQLGPMKAAGEAEAVVETPRGRARLQIRLEEGQVQSMTLHTPTQRHLDLVPKLAAQQELGDALLAVASLDLSPWEVLP